MVDLLRLSGNHACVIFSNDKPQGGFDEYFIALDGPRSCFEPLVSSLGHPGLEEIRHSHRSTRTLLQQVGATFQLYDRDTELVASISSLFTLCQDWLQGTTKNWAASLSGMSSHHEKISPGAGLPGPAGVFRGGKRQFFVVSYSGWLGLAGGGTKEPLN